MEDVPSPLARFLRRHEVCTVKDMQWRGIKNGKLLGLIEREEFQVFLTGDKSMENEQQLSGRAFAVRILSTVNWPLMRPHLAVIAQAVDFAQPGTARVIECGKFLPKRSKRPSGPV